MTTRYFVHKSGKFTGVADLPNFAKMGMKPPRSFEIYRNDVYRFVHTSTDYYIEITKEVYDIMRGV
jgi:sRNA-binding carbon storage regulator CsrA